METLYRFDFPPDIRMERIYADRPLLDALKARSSQRQTLPIVRQRYGELMFSAGYPHRPYIYCSLVSTLDGRIAYEDVPVSTYIARDNYLDPEGGILNFWSLMMQRIHADACITAAKTLAAEPEATLHICDRTLLEQRAQFLSKRSPHPLNIVISRRGTQIPLHHKIFHAQGEGLRTILVTGGRGGQALVREDHPCDFWYIPHLQALESQRQALSHTLWEAPLDRLPVLVIGTLEEEIDTPLFLRVLREMGIEQLCVECPQYMYHLMEHQVLDEFFMDFSLVFAGGEIVAGMGHSYTTRDHPHTQLICAAQHNGHFLYTRHQMRYDARPSSHPPTLDL